MQDNVHEYAVYAMDDVVHKFTVYIHCHWIIIPTITAMSCTFFEFRPSLKKRLGVNIMWT